LIRKREEHIADRVDNPKQPSLGLLDITIIRNAYGCQNESFINKIHFDFMNGLPLECIFIRAPRITSIGNNVKSLARSGQDIIMVEDGLHLATTFHPELSDSLEIHDYFLKKVKAG